MLHNSHKFVSKVVFNLKETLETHYRALTVTILAKASGNIGKISISFKNRLDQASGGDASVR